MTIDINDSTKRQFVKDYKLPIQVVQEPYFSYFLDLYENEYKSRTRYQLLVETINHYGSLDAYLNVFHEVRKNAIDFIEAQPAYKELSKDKLEAFNIKDFSRKNNLYNQNNANKTFVSIDLVTANVQSFNLYDKSILGYSETYNDFISKFTDSEYLKGSKQIRQVIFGSLSPKKQQIIQKFIMVKVRNSLIKLGLNPNDIQASSPDELVFELDNLKNFSEFLNDESLKDFKFHIEVFTLENIREDIPTFIKRFKNKEGFEIKGGNNKHMAEIFKYVKGIEHNPYDLVFFDEGRIAYYSEKLI